MRLKYGVTRDLAFSTSDWAVFRPGRRFVLSLPAAEAVAGLGSALREMSIPMPLVRREVKDAALPLKPPGERT